MRLINADSPKELYEGFGKYEDGRVVPIKIVLQNIDDMPTISMIVVDTRECSVCGTSFYIFSSMYASVNVIYLSLYDQSQNLFHTQNTPVYLQQSLIS